MFGPKKSDGSLHLVSCFYTDDDVRTNVLTNYYDFVQKGKTILSNDSLKNSNNKAILDIKYKMANAYRYGWAVVKDPLKSYNILVEISDHGHCLAIYDLLRIHLKGDKEMNIKRDVNKAKELIDYYLPKINNNDEDAEKVKILHKVIDFQISRLNK